MTWKASTKRAHKSTLATSGKKLTQLHLDLGQKDVGVYTCKECGMEYDLVKSDEVSLHTKYHASVVGGIDFNFTQKRVSSVCENIVIISSEDSKRQREKVCE